MESPDTSQVASHSGKIRGKGGWGKEEILIRERVVKVLDEGARKDITSLERPQKI